jgi:hypothetical protein
MNAPEAVRRRTTETIARIGPPIALLLATAKCIKPLEKIRR